MQASATLLLQNVPCSFIPNTELKTTAFTKTGNPFLRQHRNTACRGSEQDSPMTEFNLYELLGVDAASDRSQIKEAYRGLQKRCHPDIAGPPGHDMAIVLNEAYALLSDPTSRMAYDKELAKVADLQGYTGRPIYSAWLGSESERRAVFVDEVKCVGCLKCALFAQKTFAVESVYGRARVVAQWADPEHKIHDAIASCPVDCISIVEKSELPALEFVMSKQPRSRVRIGAPNTTGVRTADIFDEVEKFQARYAQHTASKPHSKDSKSHGGASRASAVQAIQMISNWLYWQSPITDAAPPATTQNSKPGTINHTRSTVKRLKAAVAVRKQAETTARPKESPANYPTDYWVPAALALPQAITPDSASKPQVDPSPSRKTNPPSDAEFLNINKQEGNPFGLVVPMGTSIVAAVVVLSQLGEPSSGLKEHVGGSFALAVVNSPWMQVALAGVTWYLIGMYMVELVGALRRK
ncbi:hypothetical protein C2S51_037270 [Perilla frutescens var. frutescens]|nr:hypothetical protein C2S51_037270 [Perilla frutescens var. frutescens]